jgi:hypothetical protein
MSGLAKVFLGSAILSAVVGIGIALFVEEASTRILAGVVALLGMAYVIAALKWPGFIDRMR